MKLFSISVCTIVCILLASCGDAEYRYDGEVGVSQTPGTNTPGSQTSFADCSCIADPDSENDDNKYLKCDNVWITTSKSSGNSAPRRVICDKNYTCKSPIQSQCTKSDASVSEQDYITVRCKTNDEENQEIIAQYTCDYGCHDIDQDAACNECNETGGCDASYQECDTETHQCIEKQGKDCIDGSSSCLDDVSLQYCEDGKWRQKSCAHGCSDRECNECENDNDCNPEQEYCDTETTHRCKPRADIPECSDGEFSCFDENNQAICEDGQWRQYETCAFGCYHNACLQETCDVVDAQRCSKDNSSVEICNLLDNASEIYVWQHEKDCDAGCSEDHCIDECGTYHPGTDGGRFYICSLDDIEQYRKIYLSYDIATLVFSGKIECNENCFGIPLRDVTTTIRGINDAEIRPSDGSPIIAGRSFFVNHNDSISQDTDMSNANGLKNISISDITFNSIELECNVYNCRGLLSYKMENASISNISTNNIIIKHLYGRENYGVGGLVGTLSGTSEISNITITNDLDVEGATNTGGLVGKLSADSNLTISNVSQIIDLASANGIHVESTRSDNEFSYIGYVGGLVGSSDRDLSISSIDIIKASIIGIHHVGGFIGISNGNTTIEYITAQFDSIEATDADNGFSDVGGLLGNTNSFTTILNSRIEAQKIDGKAIIGGIIGHSNGDVSIDNTEIILNLVKATNNAFLYTEVESTLGSAIGGVIGFNQYGSLELSNLKIHSNSIEGYGIVGGIIGASMTANTLLFSNITSTFHSILASDQYAGGIAGFAVNTDSIIIDDVINRGVFKDDELPGIVRADNNFAGGMFGYLKSNTLSINNVINEIHSVTSDNEAAGVISDLNTNAGTPDEGLGNIYQISNVISLVDEIEGNPGAGFISRIYAVPYSQFHLHNILNKVNGHFSGMNPTEQNPFAGFLYKVEGISPTGAPLTPIDLAMAIEVTMTNVLNDADLYTEDPDVPFAHNNMLGWGIEQVERAMGETLTLETINNIKVYLNDAFHNVFYLTPGYKSPETDQLMDLLMDCRDQGNGTPPDCELYLRFKTPFGNDLFTEYCLDLSRCPITPYHPYFTKLYTDEATPAIKSDEASIDTAVNNANEVLDSLNNHLDPDTPEPTRWVLCSELVSDSDIKASKLTFESSEGISAYQDLLCPRLTGEVTCLDESCM